MLGREVVPVTVGAAAPAVSVRGLRKAYGPVEAVRGIDFEIRAGEIFALLGPNGAGKTTTVEILDGYRRTTAVRCACWDTTPAASAHALSHR